MFMRNWMNMFIWMNNISIQITSIGGFMTPITVASVVAILRTQVQAWNNWCFEQVFPIQTAMKT